MLSFKERQFPFLGTDPALWGEFGFDPAETIAARHGPVIEIGGPTTNQLDCLVSLADIATGANKIFVSNIDPGVQEFSPVDEDRKRTIIGYKGQVDFQADGRHLPFTDNAIGAIFIFGLDARNRARKLIITEAFRVLEPDGLLLMQKAASDFDFIQARNIGFRLRMYSREHCACLANLDFNGRTEGRLIHSNLWDLVFSKPPVLK